MDLLKGLWCLAALKAQAMMFWPISCKRQETSAGVALHIAEYFFILCDGTPAQVFQVDVTFAPLESTALPGGAVYQV